MRFSSLLGLPFLLAACANASVIGVTAYDPSYCLGEPFTQTKDLSTVILGSPYTGVDGAAARRLTLDAMQDQGFGPTRFTLAPSPSPYRVVMLFGDGVQVRHERVCAIAPSTFPDPAVSTPAPGGRIVVTGVLCRGDLLLSAGVGTIPAGSPDNPAIRAGIGDLVRILFPAHNPTQDGGGDQS
jgi:hypothetical protein